MKPKQVFPHKIKFFNSPTNLITQVRLFLYSVWQQQTQLQMDGSLLS
jgi:hypothetical protein